MELRRLMTDHPHAVGETYFGHLAFALSISALLAWAALAAVIHALLPFLFQTTASGLLRRLNQRIADRGHGPREGRHVSLGRL